MKSALFAAALLLGSASAGVHKLKLKKISLSEQLVRPSVSALDVTLKVVICMLTFVFEGKCQY